MRRQGGSGSGDDVGSLRHRLSAKAEELGSARASLEWMGRALFVAEEQVKSLLRTDKLREEHLKHLQDRLNE